MLDLHCSESLRLQLERNLRGLARVTASPEKLRRAAVALCVINYAGLGDLTGLVPYSSESAALILTRRSQTLKNHPGQWALPGGRMEEGESPAATALRELSEEVGLMLQEDSVIGYLDDFVTRSGFIMTPVVVWSGSHVRLQKNDVEVSSIHRIPCAEFLRQDAPILERTSESEHPILFMPVGSSWIAAPTAAILYQFREVALLGKTTRVSHFEQPLFAWR